MRIFALRASILLLKAIQLPLVGLYTLFALIAGPLVMLEESQQTKLRDAMADKGLRYEVEV